MSQPRINSLTPLNASVELYNKLEVHVDVAATYNNPYDYDQVAIQAVFTAPNNEQIEVEGFFQKYYYFDTNGNMSDHGQGFSLRFAPNQLGLWTAEVILTDQTGTSSPKTLQFTCTPASNTQNKGFIRTSNTNYLRFDEGEQFIPVGENMCWQNGNAYSDYSNWLGKLAANGGNFFRLWHAHWGLGIEWKNGWQNYQGLRQYEQINCAYQDWLFDYSAENGMYLMLTLQHHGQVSTQVDPNWQDNPYNRANGGPCQSTDAFFTDADAIAHTQNRLRYLLARWGYSRAIMAWELFNEVDWTDNYQQYAVDIADWHAQMAAFIKQHDPYQHLVTSSFAHDDREELVWANTDIDFTQTHYYINSPNIERILRAGLVSYLDKYGKPSLTGEFGIGHTGNLAMTDPDGLHMHNGLWASLFGGGLGSAMNWWWDVSIDPMDLYRHFEPLSRVKDQVDFLEADMQPTDAQIDRATGDLIFNPSGGWGVIGTDSIFIEQNGTISPANYALGSYLYGRQWNTQFRSPPVFTVDYPDAGTFSVQTSATTGNNPMIAIWVNNVLVLQQNALPNTTYIVNLAAGQHIIRVDNMGKDWISIESYAFEGLGSQVDAYVLRAEDQQSAAGWLFNHAYNHQNMLGGSMPGPVEGASFSLNGFVDSLYFLKWYDCHTGDLLSHQQIAVTNGTLRFPIPDLHWDMAFVVDQKAPATVALAPDVEQVDFHIFPNPVHVGELVYVKLNESIQAIRVLDINGKEVLQQVDNRTEIRIPSQLSQGIYWLKIETGNGVGVKPVWVK